jgi:hypothetical protein
MASGLLIVESRPASPEEAAHYHDWYDNKHLPEILQVEGFVSARRLKSRDGDTFLAVYEIETTDDLDEARRALRQAHSDGRMTRPEGLQQSPPPIVRYFDQISALPAEEDS